MIATVLPSLRRQGWRHFAVVSPATKGAYEPDWPDLAKDTSDERADHLCNHHGWANVGFVSGLTDHLLVADVDDPERSQEILEILLRTFGISPFVRRGHPRKFQLWYKLDAEAIGTIKLTNPAVEIRSRRVQSVGYGRHPVHGFYTWIGDAEPLTHSPSHLPKVTHQQVRDFVAEIRRIWPQVKGGFDIGVNGEGASQWRPLVEPYLDQGLNIMDAGKAALTDVPVGARYPSMQIIVALLARTGHDSNDIYNELGPIWIDRKGAAELPKLENSIDYFCSKYSSRKKLDKASPWMAAIQADLDRLSRRT